MATIAARSLALKESEGLLRRDSECERIAREFHHRFRTNHQTRF